MDGQKTADCINILSRFCGPRDLPRLSPAELHKNFGIERADVMVLFGGSILCGGDVLASAMQAGAAKTYMIAGGAGHTTEALRQNMSGAAIKTEGLKEAQIFAAYLKERYGLIPDLLECASTNCGNNVTYCLELLKNIPCGSIIVVQDAAMQLRMDAGFRKHASEKTKIINYAAYEATVVFDGSRLTYAESIWGMWNMERYVSLLLGEIPRLRDDENGYGPKGKGFIAHTDIPPEVEDAYDYLTKSWQVRGANPAYASK